MIKKTFFLSLICFFLLGFPGVGFAQEVGNGGEPPIDPELEKLLQLGIEELLVSVASKRDEKIEKAPGIVSVIFASDIRSYGANDLRDLLNRLPNTYTFESIIFRDNTTSIRGQVLNHIDNHVLILLNNRPMRESFTGGLNSPIYKNFPLEAIKRIEVIRGPGSVLYGSNGFSGVINIVTWDGDELPENSLTAGYGSNETIQASGLLKASLGDFIVVGAGKFQQTTGWDFNFTDSSGRADSADFGNRNGGGFAQLKYKRLTLTGFAGSHDYEDLFGSAAWRDGIGDILINRYFFDAQYEQPLGKNWDATFNFTYNGLHQNLGPGPSGGPGGAGPGPGPGGPPGGFESHNQRIFNDFLLEGSIKGSLFDSKVNVLAGVTYQRLNGWFSETLTGFEETWWNQYLQLDYSPWDFLKFIGGVQFNKVPGTSLDISPRGGVIVNFNAETGLKLLYGKAFRAAFADAKVGSGPLLNGNPNLDSEQIATFDAQLFYSSLNFFAGINYYFSKQTQSLTEGPVGGPGGGPPGGGPPGGGLPGGGPPGGGPGGGGATRFVNAGEVHYEGVEFETRWRISPRWNFTGSVSYQENHDDTGLYGVGLIPRFMAKAGISYKSPKGFSIGLFDSYFGEAETFSSPSGPPSFNPPAEGYHWLTLKASVPLKTLIRRSNVPDLNFSIYGENLLAQDNYFPEFFSKRVNTFPLRTGAAVHGSATLKF